MMTFLLVFRYCRGLCQREMDGEAAVDWIDFGPRP